MTTEHKIHQEGDEYVCTCGLRWDIHEEDPHEEPKHVNSGPTADEVELQNFMEGFAALLERHPNVRAYAPVDVISISCGEFEHTLHTPVTPDCIRGLLLD
jgi:hypothetical protein